MFHTPNLSEILQTLLRRITDHNKMESYHHKR